MKYTCGCLNVQINVKSDQGEKCDIPSYPDEFFNTKVEAVQLNIEGIRIVHNQLVKTRLLDEWVIHQCRICESYTHASTAESQNILLNSELLHDPKKIETLEKSSDFSPVYKVILKSTDDNHTNTTVGVQSDKYESLQKALFKLKLQLNDYVKREKDNMEERIRQFEAEQQEKFSLIQGKATRDKNAMTNLFLASAKDASTSEAADQVAPLNQLTTKRSKQESEESEQQVPTTHQHPQLLHSRSAPIGNKPRVVKAQPMAPVRGFRDPEADLFDDDFDPTFSSETSSRPQQPFESSDEDEDTDDSESSSEFTGRRNMLSSSVPISVPAFKMAKPKRGFRVDEEMEDGDDEDAPRDPESIAASMKALSKSVYSDGTQIFGELPRSRFKGGGFGKM